MKTIKGPAIFLAQFCGDEKPFNNLKHSESRYLSWEKYFDENV